MAATPPGLVASTELPSNVKLSPEDFMRIRASTNESVSTVIEWKGQVLSYKPGVQPSVVFNVQGMNIARSKKLSDGSYDLLAREMQLYLDPVTNEILHSWHNPYNSKNVNVVHVANNPVYQNIPTQAQYSAMALPGGMYSVRLSIPLAYPNPLDPTGNPNSPLYPYMGPYQLSYAAIESFTFTFSAIELASKMQSLPSTEVYWTRMSPLLPFMATPSTDTSLLFIATGWKVAGGWQGLSTVVRDVINTTLPAYKDAPTERTSPGGGVTSWSYFAQPDVFKAYLDGVQFPLPDPPRPS